MHRNIHELKLLQLITSVAQWRRSQVKSRWINIEKIEGVGSGEGLCPPQLRVWGLDPRKKYQFCGKKYAILRKFWYFFPILQQKVGGGGLSPSSESGGTYPPVAPCSDAYAVALPARVTSTPRVRVRIVNEKEPERRAPKARESRRRG